MREIQVIRATDGSLYFDIPTDILEKYGWEDGDDIEFVDLEDGSCMLRKVNINEDS